MSIRISLLDQSRTEADRYNSVLISNARALAAFEVAAAHLRAALFTGYGAVAHPTLAFQTLAFLTGFAHEAVVLFFLISGWLVGGSYLNKAARPGALVDYMIDRVTRLWVVLLPTFIVILALGIVDGTIDPRRADLSPSNSYSLTALVGNLLGLQKLLVPSFGGNFPLWSLANESWYYLMFPLLVLGWRAARWPRRVLLFGAAAVIGILLPVAITVYFSLWLLGVACSRVELRLGECGRWTAALAFGGTSVYLRRRGLGNDLALNSFGQDLALSVLFMLWLVSLGQRIDPDRPGWWRLKRWGDAASKFSFTLYVLHMPVIAVMLGAVVGASRHGDRLDDYLIYAGVLGTTLVVAFVFARLFEAQTWKVRSRLKRALGCARTVTRGSPLTARQD